MSGGKKIIIAGGLSPFLPESAVGFILACAISKTGTAISIDF